MRRLGLLIAVGATWLFLAALPALADGGPHVSSTNNGSSVLTADSCAGCHRAHTAQGEYLINAANEEALCLTCHGSSGTGATTDVVTGLQYAPTGDRGPRTTTQLGALRDGGFQQARLGTPERVLYPRNSATPPDISARPKVAVGSPANVTSVHMELPNVTYGFTNPGVAWGNGQNGSGVGPSVSLSCASCHNPHGNDQYRILNPMPKPSGVTNPLTYSVSTNAGTDTISTTLGGSPVAHQFVVGDYVTTTGVSGVTDGIYRVTATSSGGLGLKLGSVAVPTTPTLDKLTGFSGTYNITASGTSGTIGRYAAIVDDSPNGTPDANGVYPTKNYTVIQVKGSTTTTNDSAAYLLYASQVSAGGYAATDGDYMHRNVPWNPAAVPGQSATCSNANFVDTSFGQNPACATANDAPNGRPATAVVGATIELGTPPAGTPGNTIVASPYAGQVGFSDQITAWCTTCHTRYYSTNNPNPTGTAVGPPPNGGIQTNNSSWWFPRPGSTGIPSEDATYKYQHRTVPNRACVTCHVSHGSNAAMTGQYSSTFTYPNNAASASSRLLKVANRGTCQMCHEPTTTLGPNTYTGVTAPGTVP